MAPGRIDNIVFELTQACNQCCRFCYNYWRDGSTPLPPPDPAQARKTLRKLLSQASIGTISFSGGEPMLLRNIHDLALSARFKGSHVNVLTNGTLLTPDALENFISIGIGAIQIPILSDKPGTHEYLTGLPGSWAKATYSKGVRNVMVNRFNIGGMGLRHTEELVMDTATLKKAFADVEQFAVAHPEMHFVSGVCTPLCLLDPTPYPHIRFTSCNTDFRRRPVAVNYAGDVRFCNHSPRVIGNIHDRPIGEILTDPENVARYAEVPDMCRDCALLSRCNGGCRAASEQVYGTFAKVDPILEMK